MKCLQALGLSMALLVSSVSAEPTTKLKLELLRLTPYELSAKASDEVYADITVYRPDRAPEHYHIPKELPSWSHKDLEKLHKVVLWRGELAEVDSASLLISLMERDSTPHDPDEMIGTVSLRIKKHDGELKPLWTMPNRSIAIFTISTKYGSAERFNLNGPNGYYEMILLLSEDKG